MLSSTLVNFEEKDVDPYINFLVSFGEKSMNLILDKQVYHKNELESQNRMKIDFIQCYDKVFSYLNDE